MPVPVERPSFGGIGVGKGWLINTPGLILAHPTGLRSTPSSDFFEKKNQN